MRGCRAPVIAVCCDATLENKMLGLLRGGGSGRGGCRALLRGRQPGATVATEMTTTTTTTRRR